MNSIPTVEEIMKSAGVEEPVKPALVDQEFEDVFAFHEKFGLLRHRTPVHLTKRKLMERIVFLQEELNEFVDAVTIQDLAEMADALIDLVYVAKGTAVMLGLPWAELWADVHRANMAKVRGISHRGHAVDCVKPPGWEPPMTEKILAIAGYDGREWCREGAEFKHEIDEVKCLDDQTS